jgi:hypothetical protein
VNEILHSFALWLRQAHFEALILEGAVFMFWLLPTLESAGSGPIGNERKSMLGIKPSATGEVVRVTQKRGKSLSLSTLAMAWTRYQNC